MSNKPDIVENVLYKEMDIKLYHAQREYKSSSDFKQLSYDPLGYHYKSLGHEQEIRNSGALAIGTYVHALILEPHLVEDGFISYKGVRRGAAWESFANRNRDKTILYEKDKSLSDRMVEYFKGHKTALSLIDGGHREVSLFSTYKGHKLRVRPDCVVECKDHIKIIDLKTTSDYPVPKYTRNTCYKNNYDLSAAMYGELLSKHFKGKPYEFYFIFLYKEPVNVLCFKASPEFLDSGKKKFDEALNTMNTLQPGELYYDNRTYEI